MIRRSKLLSLIVAFVLVESAPLGAQVLQTRPTPTAVPELSSESSVHSADSEDNDNSHADESMTPSAVVEKQPIEQPSAVFEPISQEQLDLFLDSIRSSMPFKLPPAKESEKVDSNTAGIWAGSAVNITSEIHDIVLRFRRKADELVAPSVHGDVSADKLLEQFDLSVDQQYKWISLQLSNPERRVDAAGIKTRVDKPKVQTRTPFFRGQRDSGMYVSIPPFYDMTNAWGIMVCPRRLMKETASASRGLTEYILGPSPYELSEISFSMLARGEATMATAGQEGKGVMTLALSKDLPPSMYASDESVSSVPRVSVSYKPKANFDFYRFAPDNDVQQGALLEVNMLNKSGYNRRQFFSHALYVKKMIEPSPISIVADGRRVTSDTGECYIVINYKYSWMEYEKLPPQNF